MTSKQKPMGHGLLLPCPFCGGPAHLRKDFGLHEVACLDCDIATGACADPVIAIAAWNTRHKEPMVSDSAQVRGNRSFADTAPQGGSETEAPREVGLVPCPQCAKQDEIAALKAKLASYEEFYADDTTWRDVADKQSEQLHELNAKLDALREENERLKSQLEFSYGAREGLRAQRDSLRQDSEALDVALKERDAALATVQSLTEERDRLREIAYARGDEIARLIESDQKRLATVQKMGEELEEWRSAARAIGIEGTADPRKSLTDLFYAHDNHHTEHHDREQKMGEALKVAKEASYCWGAGCSTRGHAQTDCDCRGCEAVLLIGAALAGLEDT